jgi:anti-sigma regulatory factor (Ser/Thr protein kinase)
MHPGPVDAGPRGLRVWLTRAMEDAGLGREAAEDMLLAAGEVLGNAYRFGASVPGIRVGSEGATFVLEVSADAPWSDDPLAGYLPPRSGASSGAGLWIARQLTSHLELSQGSAGGLVVRLWA